MNADLSGMCIIEISGDSCASCHALIAPLNELAGQFGYKFIRLDAEDDGEVIQRFSIVRVPTVILAEDGREFARCTGYQPPEILEYWLESKTEEHKKSQG